MDKERVLVVDDEPGVRSALEAILRDEGYDVRAVGSGEEAVEAMGGGVDAVLLDVWLPGMDGLETLLKIREARHDAEVVMISGHGTIETAVRAAKLGAFDFVEKPLSLEKTLLVLRNALRQRRLERRNRRLLEQLAIDTEIDGRSPAAERLRSVVAAAAATDAPVLICGEPGTGRETVARRIHAQGRRGGEAFVVLPCGALDASAAREAIFGREGEKGRLALAERGTLFLEDAERLDPGLQDRVAALVDPREAGRPDVRWLASAPPEPGDLRPTFRERLGAFRISVPPLRDRREDIALLAERFMRSLAAEYGRPERRFAPECLAALGAHAWPGNVRELRSVVERMLLEGRAETITVHDLPPRLGGEGAPSEDLYREFPSLAEGLRAFERYAIRRAIRESGGDVAAASMRLGLDRRELEELAAALGV